MSILMPPRGFSWAEAGPPGRRGRQGLFSVPVRRSSWAESLPRAGSDVHVWRISLREGHHRPERLESVLSCQERERARRLATEKLTRRFTACRAATRLVLATYMGVEGGRIEFCCGPDGKPYLAVGGEAASIKFNVSHSEDLAVVAVAWQREVGVDVEAIKPMTYLEQMVRRCLGPSERRAYQADPTADRVGLFLRYWTHKEAYLKAIGTGLRTPLDSIQFDFPPSTGAPVVSRAVGPGRRPAEIQVVGFEPDDGYCGALAAEGPDAPEVRLLDWRDAG